MAGGFVTPGGAERLVFGSLAREGLEVVEREGRYFLRYDAGAHQLAWREDEITAEQFALLRLDLSAEQQVVLELQRRLQQAGVDTYRQNWTPPPLEQPSTSVKP